ncbi:MAG: hypothetical protein VX733_08365 [Candidatus Latescibacterota bacterium]|nr:hypothetical protein [Candidatus Latescibacterota bacterium]
MGAIRTGAVHSSVRKALRMGATAAELKQVVALTAGTLGMPSAVTNFTWLQDVLDEQQRL